MRNFKKLPEMAGVTPAPQSTDPGLPYNVFTSSGDGFTIGQLPYSPEGGGQHSEPWTAGPSLVRVGRT